MNLPLLNKYYEIEILQEGKTYLTSTSNTFKVRFPFSKYPFFHSTDILGVVRFSLGTCMYHQYGKTTCNVCNLEKT